MKIHASTLTGICGAIAILLLMACAGFVTPIDFLIALTFGWIRYLSRTLPNVELNGLGIVGFVALLGMIAVVVHISGKRLMKRLASSVADRSALSWRPAWPAGVLGVAITMFLGGISGVGIAHQALWLATSKEPLIDSNWDVVLRTQSKHNLHQIGLAVQNYHDVNDRMPQGGLFTDTGMALHGWQTLLLPYVDESPTFQKVDLTQPWTAEKHRAVFQKQVFAYQYPTRSGPRPEASDGYAATTYAVNSRLLGANRSPSLREISDGAMHTILCGEIREQFPAWGSPTNWRDPSLGINRSPDSFGSPFQGGVNFLFCDGHTRFLNEHIDSGILKAMATPNGGEVVEEF